MARDPLHAALATARRAPTPTSTMHAFALAAERTQDRALARELIELGLSSATTPTDAPLLAQLGDAAEWATWIVLLADRRDRAPAIARWLAHAGRIAQQVTELARAGELALPDVLAGSAPVLHACATIAERQPALATTCEALWQTCSDAVNAQPVAEAARALADRVRDRGWRYAELARAAQRLARRTQVPAATVLELALGTLPLPFGHSDTHERARGRTGHAATAVDAAITAIAHLELVAGDTFYDLGAGLGLPTCVAALTSTAVCRGVEYHAAYVARASAHARRLGLANARFFVGDATTFDFSDGNKFYLFNPFGPTVLRRVAARLSELARRRPIRIACWHVALPGFDAVISDGPLRVYASSPARSPRRDKLTTSRLPPHAHAP